MSPLEIKIREWIDRLNANQLQNFVRLVQKVSGFNLGEDINWELDWQKTDGFRKKTLIAVVAWMLIQLENTKNNLLNFKSAAPFREAERVQAKFQFLPQEKITLILTKETNNSNKQETAQLIEKLNTLMQNIHHIDTQISQAMQEHQTIYSEVVELEQQVRQAQGRIVTNRYQAVPINRQAAQDVAITAPTRVSGTSNVTPPIAAFIPIHNSTTYAPASKLKPSVMRKYEPEKTEEKETLEIVEKNLGKKLQEKSELLETNRTFVISLHFQRSIWVQEAINLIRAVQNNPRVSFYDEIAAQLRSAPRLSSVQNFNQYMDDFFNQSQSSARMEMAV